MLDRSSDLFQRGDRGERRVQLSSRPLVIELAAPPGVEPLPRHVERVLLVLGALARDSQSVLLTAQLEVIDRKLRGEQDMEVPDVLFGRAHQGVLSLRRFTNPAEQVEL